MRAFIDQDDNLCIWVDVETPDDLLAYDNIQELIAVLLPGLIPMENPDTNSPIYKSRDEVFYLPDYLTVNPLEYLRDNQELTLKVVK